MAVGCPAKCAKVLLIVFNIIFWLCGAALLAVGIWLRVDPSILQRFGVFAGDSQLFEIGAYVLIAVGAFIFITGFLGCCGAIKENACMLGTYIFLLVLVMLVEIAAAVLAFVFKNQLNDLVTENLADRLDEELYGNRTAGSAAVTYTPFGVAMNGIQYELKCCGLEGPGDWSLNPSVVAMFDGNVPFACCPLKDNVDVEKLQSTDVLSPPCVLSEAYTQGCKDGLIKWVEENALILIGLGIGIACLEIFGIIFAVCVCRNPTED